MSWNRPCTSGHVAEIGRTTPVPAEAPISVPRYVAPGTGDEVGSCIAMPDAGSLRSRTALLRRLNVGLRAPVV